jgi:hypothetical protein
MTEPSRYVADGGKGAVFRETRSPHAIPCAHPDAQPIVMLLTMFSAYEMSAETARGRSWVRTERWVDLIEVAMMVSLSLTGVRRLPFD